MNIVSLVSFSNMTNMYTSNISFESLMSFKNTFI